MASKLEDPRGILRATKEYVEQGFVLVPLYGVVKNKTTGQYDCQCRNGSRPLGDKERCRQEGKHPSIPKWNELNTPEDGAAAVIAAYQQNPHLNIAVLTGPSGLLVVDLDVKPDRDPPVDGVSEFMKLLEEGKHTLPSGPLQISGGGKGAHILFRIPLETALSLSSNANFQNGVELKSNKSLINLWPSVHASGNLYTWEIKPGFGALDTIPDAEGWLIALAQSRGRSGPKDEYSQIDMPVTAADLSKLAKDWLKAGGTERPRNGRIIRAMLELDVQKPQTVEAMKEALPEGSRQLLLGLSGALAKAFPQIIAKRVLAPLKPAIDWRVGTGAGTNYEHILTMLKEDQNKLSSARSGWRMGLKTGEKDAVLAADSNTLLCLENHPQWKGVLGFDVRRQVVVYLQKPPMDLAGDDSRDIAKFPLPFCEHDLGRFQTWFVRHMDMIVARTSLLPVIEAAARKARSFDPVKDYFENLSWDGVPRLDGWLPTYAITADNDYTRAVGPKALIAAVTRTYEPGSKSDYMLILEGRQGLRKSMLWASLVPERSWFTDHMPDLGNKDAMLQLSGKLIIEMAELSAIKGAVAQERVKSFLTSATDTYRPPYGRTTEDFPRRSIIVGSTNEKHFLVDDSGNRRYWPVKMHHFIPDDRIAALINDRDQLWAEAVARYKEGETVYLSPDFERLAKSEQDAREAVEVDPMLDRVREILKHARVTDLTENQESEAAEKAKAEKTSDVSRFAAVTTTAKQALIRRGFVRSNDILDCLEIAPERQTTKTFKNLKACMARLGWRLTKDGDGNRGYERADAEGALAE